MARALALAGSKKDASSAQSDASNPVISFLQSAAPACSESNAPDVLYLWPCNERAWYHWREVQSQWRVGMAGGTGLDYAGVRAYLDECALPPDERRDAWAGIRACEAATLQAWSELRSKEQ